VVVAQLARALLEDVRVQPPGCAEDEGDAAEDIGAFRPARGISSRAQALADGRAGARAEDVVMAELDDPPPAVRIAEADAKVQMPGLALAERHLDIGERIR